MSARLLALLSMTAVVGCSMAARSPERVAAEQRRASIPFPCAEESKKADARISELVTKGEPMPDLGYSWKCTVGESKPWFIKLSSKEGAAVLATREVIGSKTEQWSGAADASEIVLQTSVPVIDENGTAVESKSILHLKRNGETLEGTMDRPGGWFPQVHANSWTCKPSKVVCTR